MKRIFTFLVCLATIPTFAQIEGTWRLAPNAGALAVGPNQGDGSWWSSSMNDVTTRSCLFDDSITFSVGGLMTHYMDGSTWREGWQGIVPDGCGTPVAPHDGVTNAPYSYSFNNTTGELTVNGIGAHLGLAKVVNSGELTDPANAPASITYLVNFTGSNDTMNVDINVGFGWWHYTYVKSSIWNLADPNVTFRVNMSNYTGTIATGVYVNGSFNGWCGSCNPMNNIGNGIWETTLPIPSGSIEYKFTVDGFTDEEMFAGTEPCIDPFADAFNNRYLSFTGDVVLPAVCFESCDPCLTLSPEILGTWKLKAEAGSLAVGPNQGDGSWWSNQAADVVTRACLFDDSIKFDASGVMTHYMDGSTWLETWQGVAQEGCGTPVAPHDGVGPFTYSYNSATGELTTIGVGAHIGLAKAYNGGELTNPSNAVASISYLVTLSNNNNTLTADINIGGGWWRFIYEKTQPIIVANPNITFRVDMSDYTSPINTGVYINGSFNSWCGACNPLTNVGNNVYEITLPLPTGPIEYLFTVDEWTDLEAFDASASCIDPVADGFNNRYLEIVADATLPTVCFNSCTACLGSGISELNESDLVVSPNPANDHIIIHTPNVSEKIELIDVNGNIVLSIVPQSNEISLDISILSKGIYLVNCVNENYIAKKRIVKN